MAIPRFSVFTLFLSFQLAISSIPVSASIIVFPFSFESRVPRFIFEMIVRSQKRKVNLITQGYYKGNHFLENKTYMQANIPAYI